jgi:hypothetical protein
VRNASSIISSSQPVPDNSGGGARGECVRSTPKPVGNWTRMRAICSITRAPICETRTESLSKFAQQRPTGASLPACHNVRPAPRWLTNWPDSTFNSVLVDVDDRRGPPPGGGTAEDAHPGAAANSSKKTRQTNGYKVIVDLPDLLPVTEGELELLESELADFIAELVKT